MEEIKVGDIVRVSEDAPKSEVLFYDRIFTITDCIVDVILKDKAWIIYNGEALSFSCIVPIKYLVKVNAEPKFSKGDKVRISCAYDNGEIWDKIMHGRIATIKSSYRNTENIIMYKFEEGIRDFAEHWLEPYAEPKEPTIKVGDMVRVLVPSCLSDWGSFEVTGITPREASQKEWRVIGVQGRRGYAGCTYVIEHDDSVIYNIPEDCIELIQPKEPTEKSNVGKITIPVEADLTDSFWQRYAADLAKEIAVKMAYPGCHADTIEWYAVAVAKSVVENLKKK